MIRLVRGTCQVVLDKPPFVYRRRSGLLCPEGRTLTELWCPARLSALDLGRPGLPQPNKAIVAFDSFAHHGLPNFSGSLVPFNDTALQKIPSPVPSASTAFYDGLKSPADVEGGALRPGGPPSSLYSRQNIGLAMHQLSIAVTYGSITSVIYSVLNNYLNMSAVLVATATALVKVPNALRLFTGLISDCYPIFGYRRRPYLGVGLGGGIHHLLDHGCASAWRSVLWRLIAGRHP
jgi:hypothetical protein